MKQNNKHIDWMLGLKCSHQFWSLLWPWPWLFQGQISHLISGQNGPIAMKWKRAHWLNAKPWIWPLIFTLTMTLTLKSHGHIFNLIYLMKKWSKSHETKNKHMPGLSPQMWPSIVTLAFSDTKSWWSIYLVMTPTSGTRPFCDLTTQVIMMQQCVEAWQQYLWTHDFRCHSWYCNLQRWTCFSWPSDVLQNKIGTDNGLLFVWHQAITWTNNDLLSIGSLETTLNEIWIKILRFSSNKMHFEI